MIKLSIRLAAAAKSAGLEVVEKMEPVAPGATLMKKEVYSDLGTLLSHFGKARLSINEGVANLLPPATR